MDDNKCKACDDGFWVCENHPDRPWDGTSKAANACGCGAGMPCLLCNPCDDENPPKDPPNFKIIHDKDGWRN